MSSSTITLYYLRKSFAGKNLVIEDLSDLLTDDTYIDSDSTLSITNFQYLRLQKEMTIKISAMQEYSEPTNQTWNYCRIMQDGDYTYYFITNIKQIAQQTIEIHLVMDVLNTFPFSSYTLSPKTHILRRHKDRMTYYDDSTLYIYNRMETNSTAFINFINNEETEQSDAYNIYFSIDADVLKSLTTRAFDVASNYQQVRPWFYSSELESFEVYQINGSGVLNGHYVGNMIRFGDGVIEIRSGSSPTGESIPTIVHSFTQEDYTGEYKLIFYFSGTSYTFLYYDSYNESWVDSDTSTLKAFTYEFTQYNISEPVGCANRIIDKHPEGINPILFKSDDDIILTDDDGSNSWYLVYSSSLSVVTSEESSTEPVYVNPVNILIMGDQSITSYDELVTLRFYPSDVKQYNNVREYVTIPFVGTSATSGASVVVGGTTYNSSNAYAVILEKVYNTSDTFARVWVATNNLELVGGLFIYKTPDYTNISYIDINTAELGLLSTSIVGNFPPIFKTYIAFKNRNTGTFISWSEMDLSDSRLIKAINLPYSPLKGLVHYNNASTNELTLNSEFNCLEVENPTATSFDRVITFETNFLFNKLIVADVEKGTFDPYNRTFDSDASSKYNQCESKLYNDEFQLIKFVYDTYMLPIPLQNSEHNAVYSGYLCKFPVRYVASKNIVSRFMFELPYIDELEEYSQDYPKSLIIDRNNEKALYTNAYINYIKNGGFSYESNKNNRTTAINTLTTALSIAGAIASFASTSATGGFGIAGGITLTTSAITSIANNIKTAHENDMSLANKMNQLANQATSVNANDDVELFSAIDGNKAKIVFYEPREEMTNALRSLFHHYGYATNETATPTSDMLSSRIYFNFIQADIEFSDAGMPTEYQELIKQKWSEGVTFVHHVEYNDTDTWDIDQEYENWETSIL